MDSAIRVTKRYGFWLMLLIGVVLFYLAFREISFDEIRNELKNLDYFWVGMILVPSWAGQFIRAWRWKLLLDTRRQKTKFFVVYHALLSGYMLNLLIPRAGEISRCVAVQQLEGTGFARTLGTVVIERIIDVFFLFLVVAIAFIIQWNELNGYITDHILFPLQHFLLSKKIYLVSAFAAAGLLLLFFILKRKTILHWLSSKTAGFSDRFNEGLRSFFLLGTPGMFLFIFLSLLIWCGYFFTTWLWFFALPTTNGNISMAFMVMVVGSVAKTLPIQGGGMGAYHMLIGKLLLIYGVSSISSNTFALLNHGFQTVFYLLFGAFSWWWIFSRKKKISILVTPGAKA